MSPSNSDYCHLLRLNKQLIIPEFGKENKDKNKSLEHNPQPLPDSADIFQDSEYRQLSRLVPELYEPSNIPHPIVMFSGCSPESDASSQIVNRQTDGVDGVAVKPSSLGEEEQVSSVTPEYNALPDCTMRPCKTANESEQKTALNELSEDILIGANMLSLLPKGHALGEAEGNYESQGTSDEDEDDNVDQDEEDISSVHIATTYHTREPVLMERSEGTCSKDEESETSKGDRRFSMREQSLGGSDVYSSESQDLLKRIQNAEDIYIMSYETGERIEAQSVSSADMSNQNVVFEVSLPENEKIQNLDHHKDRDRAEAILEREQTVKKNPKHSYSRELKVERQRESHLKYDSRSEIPVQDYVGYVENAEMKGTYKTDDLANIAQSTEVSETDDEKLRMRQTTFNFSGRSGSVSSSVSITEHLSHSHNKWSAGKGATKGRNHNVEAEPDKVYKPGNKENKNTDKIQISLPSSNRLQQEVDEVEYGSDFEVSDVEGVSISASSLTSTSIPDDLVTPGEEEF